MSSTVKKSAGRRTAKEAEEDQQRIIQFLAENEDGKSQNQIFQALQKTTNWSTLRRDLAKLREEGLLSTEKGKRGAILHYVKSKGLLKYLSQYGKYRPETILIHTPNKDVDTHEFFTKELKDYQERLGKLVVILEREGKRLQFTILSEIRTLLNHVPPLTTGSTILDIILNVAESSEIWKPTINYEKYYELQREKLEDILKHLEVIKTYPSLRYSEGFDGKKGKTFKEDLKEHYDLQKELIEQETSLMMRTEEDALKRMFTEAFLEGAYFIFNRRKINIPNTKLHKIALEITRVREQKYYRMKSIADVFAD